MSGKKPGPDRDPNSSTKRCRACQSQCSPKSPEGLCTFCRGEKIGGSIRTYEWGTHG